MGGTPPRSTSSRAPAPEASYPPTAPRGTSTMQRRSKRVLSLATGISTLAGCVALLATQPAQAAGPVHAFPSHQTYKVGVMPSASQSARDAAVKKQYDSWKATYLVHGCATNEYYVSTKGDGDGTNTDPRPSDHMIDPLRAFAAYDTSHDWNKVIART